MFGAPNPTTPGFGTFGATSAAPGFTATAPNPGFGSTALGGTVPAAGFGTQATPAFGTPAGTSPGFQFGSTQPSGFSLNSAQPQQNLGSTLGAVTGGTSGGAMTFGTPTTSSPLIASSLGFGSPTPTLGGSNFSGGAVSFGTPTSSVNTGFSGGGLTFGAQTTAPTTFAGGSFGTPTAPVSSLGSSFSLPTAPAATSSLFGTSGLNLGSLTTSTAAPSFGVGATPATTTGFSLGLTPTTSSVLPSTLPFGTQKGTGTMFGTPISTASSSLGLNLSSTTTSSFSLGGNSLFGTTAGTGLSVSSTAAPSVGLGGVDSTQAKIGLAGTGVAEPKHVKENQLPDPILVTFTEFQSFIKQQKSLSVDIAHSSSKPVKKVQEDIDSLESLLANITSGLVRNSVTTEKLKGETAQALFHADMAQRMRDAPSSLGSDQYFTELVARFEADAERLKVQVETAGRHLRSITQSSALSPQELTLAMRRLHETLVVLAARVQSVHVAVQNAQEEYRHLRHVYLKEDLPVIVKHTSTSRRPAQRSLTGPTPFSETSGMATLSMDALSMLAGGVASPLAPVTSASGWLGTQTPGTSLMASPTSSFLSPVPVDNSGFQLSKPPVGTKRNKR